MDDSISKDIGGYEGGVHDTMVYVRDAVRRLNKAAGDDKAFRNMVLAEFLSGEEEEKAMPC